MIEISLGGRFFLINKRNRIFTSTSNETITIFEREGMYERRIEYKDLSFIENSAVNSKNNANKDRASHSFGFIHNIPEEGIE